MMYRLLVCVAVVPAILATATPEGCDDQMWRPDSQPFNREAAPQPKNSPDTSALISGSVGEQTLMLVASPEPLRGFGLVVGLNGKGSSDCPTAVRDYLIDFLAKQVGPQGGEKRPRLSPGELIDSPDTAVVEVTGFVPAGTREGARFDLRVRTVAGSSAQSLEGGLLLPTQLRFFDRNASGTGMFAGPVLAEGGGPVFVSPFANSADPKSDADPRQGLVLGGGRTLEARPLRLTLLQPSYSMARAIERRINERFGQKPKAATAVSKGYLVLETPHEYVQRPDVFRQLVAYLYLDRAPEAAARKLRELNELATQPDTPLEALSLAWEGFGAAAIPHVQPFYASSQPGLLFYAARAGFRLGDPAAVPVLGQIAAAGPHSLRLLAVREFGASNSPQAAGHLAPLLSDPDREIRIAAYEALLGHGHPAIKSTRFGFILDRAQLNFSLDVVDCEGPPLIYVRRTRLPRIAVFGAQMPVVPPVFYTHPEDSLTVHTTEGSDDVRLFIKRGRLSDEIVVPPRVVDVITALAALPERDETGRLRGLGLPYSRVVHVLASLSRTETIPAPLVLEQTPLTDLLGPEVAPERPESEESRPGPPPLSPSPATEPSPDVSRPPPGRPEAR